GLPAGTGNGEAATPGLLVCRELFPCCKNKTTRRHGQFRFSASLAVTADLEVLLRCRHCGGSRILCIELNDKSPRDIHCIGGINKGHLAAVDDDVDVMGLGISFQRLADIIVQRLKDLTAPLVVQGLSVFSFTLVILL